MKGTLTTILVALFFVAHGQLEFLTKVNIESGKIAIIDSIPEINYILLNATAYDENNKRYILKGVDFSGTHRLFCIDAKTGALISQPQFSDNVGELHYDNSTNTLFGLYIDPTTQKTSVISLDIPTAAITIVKPLSVSGFTSGSTTFDEVNHQFIFEDKKTMYKINVNTGTISSVPIPVFYNELHFDNKSEKLYGLVRDQSLHVVEINTSTGDYTTLTSAGVGVLASRAAYNACNSLFTYCTIDQILYTVNVVTKTIVFSAPFRHHVEGRNVIEFHYDNSDSTLYALHWGKITIPSVQIIEGFPLCKGNLVSLTSKSEGLGYNVWQNALKDSIGTGDSLTIPVDSSVWIYLTRHFSDTNLQVTDSIWLLPPEKIAYTIERIGDKCKLPATFVAIPANKYDYNWNGGTPSNTATFSSPQKVELMVTDKNGCTADSTFMIPSPIVDFSVSRISDSCSFPQLVEMSVPTYSYSVSDSAVSNPMSIWHSGSYIIQGSDSNGCIDNTTITVWPEVDFDISLNPDSCDKSYQFMMSNSNYSYLLDGTPISNPYVGDIVGPFTIKCLPINGCSVSKRVVIPECILTETPVWIPNAFSPNSDEQNRTFRPVGDFIKCYELNIYNKWGGKIFQSTEYQTEWDGHDEIQGVYIYMIKLILKNDKQVYRSGTVTLLR